MQKVAPELAQLAVAKLVEADRLIIDKLGISTESIQPGRVVLSMKIQPWMVNSQDLCHGGFLFSLADTAAAYVSASMNVTPVTTEGGISFLSGAMLGESIRAEARIEFLGDKTVHSLVRITKGEEKLLGIYKCTNLIRGRCIES